MKIGYNLAQMLRRFLLATVLCFVLLLSSTGGVAWAQTTNPTENPNGYQITTEEINAFNEATADCSAPSLECLVRNTTRFVAIEWLNDIVGYPVTFDAADPTPGTSRNSVSPIVTRTGGAADGLVSLISGMYSYQPAKTSRYVADVLDNAGVASPAYAQGLGFASLDPIMSLWKSFRNVAYFFFIAVIIVIGIMIMLRQKISAQASVTAQQALPSIMISLILVTFSYAIAGILIDVMYLSMYLIVGLFQAIAPDGVGAEMITYNIFQLTAVLFKQAVWNNFSGNTHLVTSVIDGLRGGSNATAIDGFFGFLGGLTLSIILAVAVLIGMVKLFFELLKSYASIIMGVVFAPIYLMMGAFPGRNTFGPWLKNMVGNLAAFPTVLLFVIIFQIFTRGISENNQGGFMPPYLIGNGQSGIAGYMIGLAILLALPEIVKEVKKKMGASEGGFGFMVAAAANARGKEAWNKGARGITTGLATGVGLGTVGAIGGVVYGSKHGGAGQAVKHGMIGGGAGLATPVVMGVLPSALRTANRVNKYVTTVARTATGVASFAPGLIGRLPDDARDAMLRVRPPATQPQQPGVNPQAGGTTSNQNLANTPIGGGP